MKKGEKKIEVKYLGYKSEFEPPKPLPFGAHKYVNSLKPDLVENKGRILSTTFFAVLVTDGVEGKPFSYTVTY